MVYYPLCYLSIHPIHPIHPRHCRYDKVLDESGGTSASGRGRPSKEKQRKEQDQRTGGGVLGGNPSRISGVLSGFYVVE